MGRGRGGAPSFCGLAVARPRARRGPQLLWPSGRASWARFLLRARVFRGPVVVPGCRNVFRGRAVVFHFRQSRKRGTFSSSLRLIRSLSTFAVETLLALRGAELPTCGPCCNSAKRELEIIAKPLGLLHEALLSGRSFLAPCAQKLAAALCPCNVLLAACQFVLFAARRFLQFVTYFVGRAARAPSCRFAFAAFDLLSCAGVEADSW